MPIEFPLNLSEVVETSLQYFLSWPLPIQVAVLAISVILLLVKGTNIIVSSVADILTAYKERYDHTSTTKLIPLGARAVSYSQPASKLSLKP